MHDLLRYLLPIKNVAQINGIGDAKTQKYGQNFLDRIDMILHDENNAESNPAWRGRDFAERGTAAAANPVVGGMAAARTRRRASLQQNGRTWRATLRRGR